jgi:hypothetical protein
MTAAITWKSLMSSNETTRGLSHRMRSASFAAIAVVLLPACDVWAAPEEKAPEQAAPTDEPAEPVAGDQTGKTTPAAPVLSNKPAPGDDLSIEQARLADRFERLETVLGRLAELSASSDPKRAKLLREAIAKSREQDLPHRFESIVSLLENERLAAAANKQTDLQNELDGLLTLLLKADRDQQVDSERRRVKKYLQEVERLIRLQKDVKARTEGDDDAHRLAKDQQEIAGKTGKLGDAIGEAERHDAKPTKDSEKPPSDKKPNESGSKEGFPKDGAPKEDGKPGGESKPSDAAPSESGQPSDSPPSPGSPSPGKSSPGQPLSGSPPESSGDENQPEQPSEDQPADRAAKQLKSAAGRMQKAKEQLDKAQRDGATEEQRKAVQELEQAKAELERVLRQLREEEMERTFTMLAARFKKMLESQIRVHDGTVRLDHVAEANRGHDDEIESARLSREETAIANEAEKALLLLREEGSSVAFPETVSLMHDDMQQVATRLGDFKVNAVTQGLEQDIIEALEETIAALQQAMNDLDKKKSPAGQSQAGEPNEPPLVEKLAELKMIRALQMRINRRTQRYGELIEGEEADKPELVEALNRLAERQQRVVQATSDLSQGRND